MPRTKPNLIGTTEAAQILDKSPRTVHRMVAAKKLVPAMTAPGGFAGTYLFERADVERLAGETAKATAS